MPDKIYKRCGSGCLRCWQNKLKHANKTCKKYISDHQNHQNLENSLQPEASPTSPSSPLTSPWAVTGERKTSGSYQTSQQLAQRDIMWSTLNDKEKSKNCSIDELCELLPKLCNNTLNDVIRKINVSGKPKIYLDSEQDHKIDILTDYIKKNDKNRAQIGVYIYKSYWDE